MTGNIKLNFMSRKALGVRNDNRKNQKKVRPQWDVSNIIECVLSMYSPGTLL